MTEARCHDRQRVDGPGDRGLSLDNVSAGQPQRSELPPFLLMRARRDFGT
jgi:hypothetical protein